MQYYEEEKDVVMCRICEVQCFKDFLLRIRNWFKQLELYPRDGFPNTFNVLLVGIFFLQYRVQLPTWNDLARSSQPWQSNFEHPHNPEVLDPTSLFINFLDFLVYESRDRKMNLNIGEWKSKKNQSRERLLLRDPVKPRNVFQHFDPPLVEHVLDCAMIELQIIGYE
jgi:hypothetical protein